MLISGGSSGLGLALARCLAREQANLILLARSEPNLKLAFESLGLGPDRVLCVPADVSQRDQVERAVDRGVERFGRIDALVLSAGRGIFGPLAELPWEDVKGVLEANFHGSLYCVRAALPHLKKQNNSQIVFISSILGLRGIPRSSVYSASKFAIMGLAESLRMELRRDGIHVLAVCPGRIATPFLVHARSVDGQRGLKVENAVDADVAADQILAAMRKHKRQLIFPFSARVLHWVNLWFPSLVDRAIRSRFEKEGLL